MKSVGFFVFGECEIYKRDKVKIRLSFYICTMHRRRKYIRCPEGRSSFGSGFPIGASSIPVGTRFSVGKSSVLYLCGADGSRNCSTPREVWLQLRRSGGKGCPLRGSISDRKRLAGGAGKHCLSAVSFAEQRYIKAPVSRCFPSYQNHHGSFPRRLSIASPSTFFVRLSLRWKWSAAPISGCSIPSVKP